MSVSEDAVFQWEAVLLQVKKAHSFVNVARFREAKGCNLASAIDFVVLLLEYHLALIASNILVV